MSYGLRVWDASGALKLEITDRTARFVGAYTIPGIAVNGSYTLNISGFTVGSWFFSANHPYNVYLVPGSGQITFYHTNLGSSASISFTVVFFKA